MSGEVDGPNPVGLRPGTFWRLVGPERSGRQHRLGPQGGCGAGGYFSVRARAAAVSAGRAMCGVTTIYS
jgi:hypothetical protein